MDANYIAYETLIANRNAALWGLGSMIAAMISGVASIITLFFAYRALSTWRDQEKTKVKLDLRNAIRQLKASLMFMPPKIDPDELNSEREQVICKFFFEDVPVIKQDIEEGEQNVKRFDELLIYFDSCQSSWLATEHLFDHTKLPSYWAEFELNFEKYVNGEGNKSALIELLNKITATPFVFESK